MTGWFEQKRKAAKAGLIARWPGAYWWYRQRRRGWAEQELRLLPALCDGYPVAADVGANHGLFTHHLTPLVETLHAFEPAPRMAQMLRRGYGKRGNLEVHEVALSNEAGEATLFMPTFLGLSGYATLESDNGLEDKVDLSDGLEEVTVKTDKLDAWDLRDLGFIKIDVEGHEQEVLEGAVETLRREPAVVLAELEERHRPGAVRDVNALMESLGYRAFFLRGEKLLDLSHFEVSVNQDMERPGDYVRNFIFIPPSRLDALVARLAADGFELVL